MLNYYDNDEYGGIFEDERYVNMRDLWIEDNAGELLNAVKSILKDADFSEEVASSLAGSHYTELDCDKFFDIHGLTWNHALCYLSTINKGYDDEVDEAYQKELHTDAY